MNEENGLPGSFFPIRASLMGVNQSTGDPPLLRGSPNLRPERTEVLSMHNLYSILFSGPHPSY